MTVCPARRVGDRILCGRLVAGRYVCQGEIATVSVDYEREWAELPRGFFAEPETDPVHWRPTARLARRGKVPSGKRYPMSPKSTFWSHIALPLTRDCPHCNVRNLVSEDHLHVL